MSETTRILKKTRALLLEEGWTQGRFHSARGRCLVGAIDATFGRDPKYAPTALERVVFHKTWQYNMVLGSMGFASDGEAIQWNDSFARTKEQVIAIIDEALDRLNSPPPPPTPVRLITLPQALMRHLKPKTYVIVDEEPLPDPDDPDTEEEEEDEQEEEEKELVLV